MNNITILSNLSIMSTVHSSLRYAALYWTHRLTAQTHSLSKPSGLILPVVYE